MSFVTKITKSSSEPVHIIACKYPDGRDCYYIIACSKQKISILEKLEDGVFNVNDYGLVIASGFGKKPTDNVIVSLRDEYNIDLDKIFS